MKKLALDGGEPAIPKPFTKWNRYQYLDSSYRDISDIVEHFMLHVRDGNADLSGYLAGVHEPGPRVRALQDAWAEKFKVKHAIACNSATSGLLVAAQIAEHGPWWAAIVPALSMSATETVLKYCPDLSFDRADTDSWGCSVPNGNVTHVAIVTDLFGHPAQIKQWRQASKFIISDSAQAVLATDEDGNYAGTTADIGVYSLNVHKQLSAGEGGIIVTNNDDIALMAHDFINHGELRQGGHYGLNLRMTELTAVVAKCQLDRAKELVGSRRILRIKLAGKIPPPFQQLYDRDGCHSACYCMPLMLPTTKMRDYAVKALNAEGFSIRAGYAHPQFYRDLPERAKWFDEHLALIELCAIDPTPQELGQIEEAFAKVAEVLGTW